MMRCQEDQATAKVPPIHPPSPNLHSSSHLSSGSQSPTSQVWLTTSGPGCSMASHPSPQSSASPSSPTPLPRLESPPLLSTMLSGQFSPLIPPSPPPFPLSSASWCHNPPPPIHQVPSFSSQLSAAVVRS